MMKKHSVLTALILAFALTSFIAPRCYADGEPIVIFVGEFSCCSDEYGSPILHCPGQNPNTFPVLAEYDRADASLKLYLKPFPGAASVQIVDQMTGQSVQQALRPLSRVFECELPESTGTYMIQIMCRSGIVYKGTFEIR